MADGFYLNLFPIGFLFQLFCCLRFLSPMLVFFRATLLFCQCWHAIIYHGVTAMTHFRAFEASDALRRTYLFYLLFSQVQKTLPLVFETYLEKLAKKLIWQMIYSSLFTNWSFFVKWNRPLICFRFAPIKIMSLA